MVTTFINVLGPYLLLHVPMESTEEIKSEGETYLDFNHFYEQVLEDVLSENVSDQTTIIQKDGKDHYVITLFPNEDRPNRSENMPDIPNGILPNLIMPFHNVDISGDLAWFKDAFAEEIKKIKDVLGKDNIEACWGLVRFAN